MTKFKSCATGFIALAAMIGSATVQADPITWFSENAESVGEALEADGVSQYGTWSAGSGSLSESLYVGSGEQDGKVCVDTDGENRLAYEPKVKLTGNTATIKLENICFTAPVEVDDSQLEGVQAAVAIVDDPDSGALTFKVAENGQWVAPPDLLNGNEIFPSSTYTVTCVFDYGAGTVTYTVDETGGEYTATLPDGAQPVSVTEFEGTCSFESLSGEREPATFTLTLPEVPGIVSYTIDGETQASGVWMIAEGATPTITIELAKGYVAKGTESTLPAMTGDYAPSVEEIVAGLELAEGVAMIGDVAYKTLQDAADAVQDNETILVWKDFSVASSIYVTNKTDITFDLNGKTVEYTGNGYALCFFDTTITLTSSVEGGEFKKTGSGTLGLVGSAQTKPDHGGKYSTATVVINDGLWYCTTASGSCFKLENGTVTLNDGVVEHAVLEANEDMVAFAVKTNTEGVISTLNLVGGTVKGYIERNETATQKYDATTLTQFSIQQNELCEDGYKMVKGEGDFYTIQEDVGPTGYKLSLTLGDNVTKVIWDLDGTVTTNDETEADIAIDAGAKVEIVDVYYTFGYVAADEGDKKGDEKTATDADIAFTFDAKELAAGEDLPPDVTPAEVGITSGAFADAKPAELNKVVKWAKAKNITGEAVNAMDFTVEGATEQAYLLNCAPDELETEKAAFKIASITFDAEGKPVIPEGVEGKTYNGTIKTQGRESIATGDWEDVQAEKAYNFFRYILVK